MALKLLAISFLLLAIASESGYAQDILGANENFLDLRDILEQSDNINEIRLGLAELDTLWTDLLPRLLENGPNFTLACIDSTVDMIERSGEAPLGIGNLSFPINVIPLLDSAGKQGAGLLGGNVILNGAYDECFNKNFTGYCVAEKVSLNNIPANIEVALGSIMWTVGLCVPKHCGGTDIGLLINSTKYLKAGVDSVTCTDTKGTEYNVGAVIMICVCIVFLLLVLLGTGVEVFITYGPIFFIKEKKVMVGNIVNEPSINNSSSEKVPLLNQGMNNAVEKKKSTDKVKPLDFILSFSLFKNVSTLLATKQAPGVITSLNGLRVISMFWVILGHTHLWSLTGGALDNVGSIPSILSRLSFQPVGNAFFSVDSFFFLSGVLVAYLTLRQMKKKKGRFPYLQFYIHRYLRLTPTYAFVLFFAWFLTSHLAYGPNLMKIPYTEQCAKTWWTNLLYINNIYPWKMMDSCVSWTWYLANDMQFYIISPLVLIPLYYLFPVGLAVACGFISSGLVISMALTGAYNLQGNSFAAYAYGYVPESTFVTYQDAIYTKPWDRIAPYIVGIILGFILYKEYRIQLGRRLNILVYLVGWIVAGFIMWWALYGLVFQWHGHTPSMFENVIYIAFSRLTWAIGLVLIVFACHNGYGWVINSFLSMPIWTPLSRMTFNAYLVHPIVLSVVYGQLQTSIHYTDITMAVYTLAFVVLSYGAAGVVCLFVELPLGTIEMLMFKLVGSGGRKSQRLTEVDMSKPKEVDL